MSFENFKSEGPLKMTVETARKIFYKKMERFGVIGHPRPDQPTVITVAGAPGSGKSTAIRQAEMGLEGATRRIISDDFDAWVPGHYDAVKRDPLFGHKQARDAGSGYFIVETIRRAKEMGANLVIERADPANSAKAAAQLRALGYRNELHIMGTARDQSWTGVFDRAERALREGHIGTNVICHPDDHDKCYAGWARAVFDAEQEKQYDRIVIARRDGVVVYDNHLVEQRDGTTKWAIPAHGLESLLRERHRAISDADARRTEDTWDRIVQSPHMRADSNLRRLPLASSRTEIVNFVSGEGSRFDPIGQPPGKFTPEAAIQWHKNLLADLSLTRSSRNQFGPSTEFDERTHRYGAAITANANDYRRSSGMIAQPKSIPSPQLAGNRNAAVPPPGGTKRTFDESETTNKISGPGHEAKRPKLDTRSRAGGSRVD